MRISAQMLLPAGLCVALAACNTTIDQPDPVASRSVSTPMLWLTKNPDSQDWKDFVSDAIDRHGAALMTKAPADIAAWCPQYADQSPAKRKAFWAYLMSSLMRFESNYNPSVTYTEPFSDSAGNRVISRGLLQISIESANGYGCEIRNAQELNDPQTNLTCAVRIMNRWIERDGVIHARNTAGQWRGLARYWSPFRRAHQRAVMQAEVSASSFCSG